MAGRPPSSAPPAPRHGPRAKVSVPRRSPSRSSPSAPSPSRRTSPASPGRRTGSAADRSPGGAYPRRRVRCPPTNPATCGEPGASGRRMGEGAQRIRVLHGGVVETPNFRYFHEGDSGTALLAREHCCCLAWLSESGRMGSSIVLEWLEIAEWLAPDSGSAASPTTPHRTRRAPPTYPSQYSVSAFRLAGRGVF